MAKGQKRSNREIKKPKKKKEVSTASVGLVKSLTPPTGIAKKKI